MSKLGTAVKVIGFLTLLGAALSKLLPVLQKEHPKLKKKVSHIGSLLGELRDEITDVVSMAELKKK